MKLFHCVEQHASGHDKRREHAWASWKAIYAQGVIPVHLTEYPRNALTIGDTRALPFLKDVLKPALDQAGAGDIVFFTNDDIVLHAGLPELLDYHVSVFGPASSQRCDFKTRMPRYESPAVEVKHGAKSHMGRDLFAATKTWWEKHWEQLGDPILGASMWDLHLACLIRKHYGIESNRQTLEQHLHPAEIPLGYISHRWHQPAWVKHEKSASEQWNRRNFQTWAAQYLPGLKFMDGGAI